MNAKYDTNLMVKVAQMYYIDGLKQEEIASELKISRSSVSMILSAARERGIVEVKYFIRNPLSNHDELSKKFEEMFNIEKCVVIPSSGKDPKILTKIVAERAGYVLNEEINSNEVVGIAWGSTCYEFMSSYNPVKGIKNISVVPLIGGSNKTSHKYQLNEMVRIFAEKIKGIPTFIHAPAVPDSLEDKKLFMQSSLMQSIVAKWKNIDIAIVGVGAPPGNNSITSEQITPETKAMFEEDKTMAVGDICARHINIYGEFIHDKYYERVIGIPIEDLKLARKVICAAAGINKTFSIIGALRADLINTFITDEQTAKSVLQALEM